jgi:hypothetical protein
MKREEEWLIVNCQLSMSNGWLFSLTLTLTLNWFWLAEAIVRSSRVIVRAFREISRSSRVISRAPRVISRTSRVISQTPRVISRAPRVISPTSRVNARTFRVITPTLTAILEIEERLTKNETKGFRSMMRPWCHVPGSI